ncbi:MAG: gliding motility-associated protein GldE [Bacteroidales bacterium]|nr:gliding motility-associated protein GldE [Bacteroidales bacterium]
METIQTGSIAIIPAIDLITGSGASMIPAIILLVLLIIVSALVSGAEVAYFSLSPGDIDDLRGMKEKKASTTLRLLSKPDRLLSTIVMANSTLNIAIIVLAAFISSRMFNLSQYPILSFVLQVAAIAFILLLFGEIMPKLYASRNQMKLSLMMAPVLSAAEVIFRPLSLLLKPSSSHDRGRSRLRASNLMMDDLSDALELTSSEIREDKEILKGIVRFGNINVNAIMCPRIDVTALEIHRGFNSIMPEVIESGFSRIPVYSDSFDHVKGILFVKDLLPHLGKPDSFRWQSLIRPPYVVPETKKISELLKEFQDKKIHMAIVVDEYGGTSGIVTLEDILEEIVGEITDETDEVEPLYRETGAGSWVFDGKILLNDFLRITGTAIDPFTDLRGDSETLAGLLLEMLGEIPAKGRMITAGGFDFTIESVEKRRIKEIHAVRKGGEL